MMPSLRRAALVLALALAAPIATARNDGDASSKPAGIAVAALVATPAAIAAWPLQGSVSFDVLYGEMGFKLGAATHRWWHDGRTYRMESNARATGLLSVVSALSYIQRSSGEIDAAGLRPLSFAVERGGRRREWSEFDWAKAEVALYRDGKARFAELSPGDQDVLTLWHQIAMAKPLQGATELTVVTGKSAALSRVEQLADETVEVPAGRFRARRLRVAAIDGSLTLDVWLARDRHQLPVRIRMRDRKGEILDQQARSIEIETGELAPTAADGR